MKVKIENAGPCRKLVKIEVPAEQVMEQWDTTLAKYAKMARVDGFREGKAPINLVAAHYHRELAADVSDRILSQAYRKALDQEKLEPIAIINVENPAAARDRPFTATFTLDVPPEFKLPKYKGLTLRGEKIEVTDEAVEERIKKLLDDFADYISVGERGVMAGDYAQIDFEAFLDGKPLLKVVPAARHLAAATDMWWQADSTKNFIPGLGEALIGMSPNQPKNVSITFDDKCGIKALASKTVEYRVTVKSIRERKAAVLNEDFCKQFQCESESAFRDLIRKKLTEAHEAAERDRLRVVVVDTLLAKTSIEVPASIVQEEARRMYYGILRQNIINGVPPEQLTEKKDQIMGEAAKKADDMVKSGYILLRIAVEENIVVTDEEYANRLNLLSSKVGMPLEQFQERIKARDEEDSIRNELRMDKTVDFILDNATIQTEGFLGRIISGLTSRKETT